MHIRQLKGRWTYNEIEKHSFRVSDEVKFGGKMYNARRTASLLPKVEPTSYYGPGLLWCLALFAEQEWSCFHVPPKKAKRTHQTFVGLSERTEAYKHVRQSVHPSFPWWTLPSNPFSSLILGFQLQHSNKRITYIILL